MDSVVSEELVLSSVSWLVQNAVVHLIGFIVLCLVWSSSWIAIKFSLEGFPPFLGAALRFSLSVLLLWIYALWRKIPLGLPSGVRRYVVFTGVVTYSFDYGLVYWGEQYISAGLASVLFATFPLLTAVISIAVFRLESFRPSMLAGLCIGFAGVAVIFRRDLSLSRVEGMAFWGGLALLGAALGAALTTSLVKKRLSHLNPAVLTLHQMVYGSIVLYPMGFLAGEELNGDFSLKSLLALIYLAVAASAFAFTLYYWLLRRVAPTTLSLFVYITPILTLGMDWAVVGETPSESIVSGAALILAGILIGEAPKYRSRLVRRGA